MFEPTSGRPSGRSSCGWPAICAGQGPNADIEALDDLVVATLVSARSATPGRALAGREPAELLEALEPRRGPERLLDFMLRAGPYGDGFGAEPDGLTLELLEAQPARRRPRPACEPRMPEVLRTPSGKIELAPERDRRRRRRGCGPR